MGTRVAVQIKIDHLVQFDNEKMRDLCVCPEPEQVLYSPTPAVEGYSSASIENYVGVGIVVSVSSIAGCILIMLIYKHCCMRKQQEDEIVVLDLWATVDIMIVSFLNGHSDYIYTSFYITQYLNLNKKYTP